MPSKYLIQTAAIDVADWEADAEYAVYPQGARDKQALIAPSVPGMACLIGGRRYLFKQSDKRFPDQFWSEVIAYRVGCCLGVTVPPAFAAVDSNSGISGALIEWFYTDGEQRFVWAGELLQNMQPGFDRKRGSDHNLKDITQLFKAMRMIGSLQAELDWRVWWAKALLFDALIGNTDRHQDNWGFLYPQVPEGASGIATLAPYFDNGTSLGNERFPERVGSWTAQQLDRYIDKGTHHVRWEPGSPQDSHMRLLERALLIWPRAKPAVKAALVGIDPASVADLLNDLLFISVPRNLTKARRDFIYRLLARRLERLEALLK